MPATQRGLLQTEMNNRILIATGGIGGVVVAICCTTPILAVVFGALGLTAWLSKGVYILIPLLLICLELVGLGLYRSRGAGLLRSGVAVPEPHQIVSNLNATDFPVQAK
jgi:mercuric ion transport protein